MQRREFLQTFRQALRQKVSQLSSVSFVLLGAKNITDEEEELGKQEFIAILRLIFPEARGRLKVDIVC